MGNETSSSPTQENLAKVNSKTIYCIVKPENYKIDEKTITIDPYHQIYVNDSMEIVPYARDKVFGHLLGVPIFDTRPIEGFFIDEWYPNTFHVKERLFYVFKTNKHDAFSKKIGFYKRFEQLYAIPITRYERMFRNRHWESFIDLYWNYTGYIRYSLKDFIYKIDESKKKLPQVKALIRFILSCEYHQIAPAESFLEKILFSVSESTPLQRKDLTIEELYLLPLVYDNFITVSPVEEMNDMDEFYKSLVS